MKIKTIKIYGTKDELEKLDLSLKNTWRGRIKSFFINYKLIEKRPIVTMASADKIFREAYSKLIKEELDKPTDPFYVLINAKLDADSFKERDED